MKYDFFEWCYDHFYKGRFPYYLFTMIMFVFWALIFINFRFEIHIFLISLVIFSIVTMGTIQLHINYKNKKKAKEKIEIQDIEDKITKKYWSKKWKNR